MEKVTFRYAQRKDVPLIMDFIKGLAEYEGMPGSVTATEELFYLTAFWINWLP